MQSIQLTAQVNEQGILQIQLPEYSDAELDILLVYQPAKAPLKRQWSQKFLNAFGSWQGTIKPEPQGAQPKRDPLP